MYAIVQQGGHQYRVSPGDRLVVDRLDAEVGSVVALAPVLVLQADGAQTAVGAPVVDGARVAAVVVSHSRGRKIRVFKYKPKKRYRRTQGHRSHLTELRIQALLAAGEPLPEAAATEEKPARAAAATATAPEAATPAEAPAPKPRSRRAAKAPAAAEAAGAEAEAAQTAAPAESEEE